MTLTTHCNVYTLRHRVVKGISNSKDLGITFITIIIVIITMIVTSIFSYRRPMSFCKAIYCMILYGTCFI